MNAAETPRRGHCSDFEAPVYRNRWRSLALALTSSLLALVPAAPTAGEIYRCTRQDGGAPLYTDTRCDAQAQPVPSRTPPTIAAYPAPDLAARHDQRLQREHERRQALDARWLAEHHRAAALDQRIRQAVVEGRVVAGMSAAQVRQAWGAPDQVIPQVGDGAPRERWVYRGDRDGTGTRSVQLEGNRVVGSGRRAPEAPSTPPRTTPPR